MLDRQTVSFVVKVAPDPNARWLGPEGDLVETEDEAARFCLNRSPTGAERIRIDRLMHELLADPGAPGSGLRNFLELKEAEEQANRRLWDATVAQLWPKGRPEVTGKDLDEQNKLISRTCWEDRSQMKLALEAVRDQLGQLEFMARWQVLAKDVPQRFRSLAELDLPDDLWLLLQVAHATAQEAVREGKPRPSGS